MKWTLWIVVVFAANPFLCPASATGNQLVNPGFEDNDGQAPADWKLYLMLQDGAFGRVDYKNAHAGDFSAVIHVPQVYEKEPANNWSQSISGDFAGTTLELSGCIKTDEAGEAALWLQCWGGRPVRLLAGSTSSTEAPMYGTQDWQTVRTSVIAPEGTRFVTVRCVLLGNGTAWYDDLCLERIEPEETPAAGAESDAEDDLTLAELESQLTETRKQLAQQVKSLTALRMQDTSSLEGLSGFAPAEDFPTTASTNAAILQQYEQATSGQLEELQRLSERVRNLEARIAARRAGTSEENPPRPEDQDRESVPSEKDNTTGNPPSAADGMSQTLVRSSDALVETNRVLRDTNQALTEYLRMLQDELSLLRAEIDELQAELQNRRQATEPAEQPAPEATIAPQTSETSPQPEVLVPPLVPRGLNWRKELAE